jgi:hypothetical protein
MEQRKDAKKQTKVKHVKLEQLQGRETATQITQVKHFWVDSKTNYEPEITKNNAQNIKVPNATQGQVIEQHLVKVKTETVSLEL